MTKQIVYPITFLVCIFFQVGISPAISIAGCAPNFLIIPVLLVTLRSGSVAGSISGFCCGLLMDFAGNGTIGCMTFTLTLLALLIGLVNSSIEIKAPLVMCLAVLCSSFFVESIYGLLVVLTSSADASVLGSFFGHIVPTAIYSAIFGCIGLVTIPLVMEDDTPSNAMPRMGGGTMMPKMPKTPRRFM